MDYFSIILYNVEAFNSRVQQAPDGTRLNPVQLNGLQGSNLKEVGLKLNEIADKAETYGLYQPIGTLYSFNLLVKSESSNKDGFIVKQNRFFVKGEGEILYNYNHGVMATDPKTAAQNFLNALETMPKLLERYQADNEKLQKDVPVLKEVIEGTWRKEPELKVLKDDLIKLDREIQLSLTPISETEGQAESVPDKTVSTNNQNQSQGKSEASTVQDAPLPNTLQGVKEIMGDRLIIASVGGSPPKVEKKESSKNFKL
ncbi:hypothetical protein GGR21_004169 [Dysgonomonas hofstadii]|uniref:DNA methylase n=1 Tax=Dysgonomonas hofstadii TaxID=637886 RepID=A0A840CQ65_9BACT|nr:hypothetical protein [Dysgonomonas hofstadii]MBB4038237.1 hypothetical protein [Dysgonomonas hofstadii]